MVFSVIVPVYNKEKYVEHCINSILNQDFNEKFEIIAIDDASTDKSLLLLENIAKNRKDDRLKIIKHAKNKGQVLARRAGIDASKGDYVMHVDADDWLLNGAFECIYTIAKQFDPDIIVLDSYSILLNGKKILRKFAYQEILTEDKCLIQKSFYFHSGTKIAKREIVQNMVTGQRETRTTADDLLYCFEIFMRAKTFYLLPKAFYVGRRNLESLTQTSANNEIMLENRIVVLQVLRKIIDSNIANTVLLNNILLRLEKQILSFCTGVNKSNGMSKSNELIKALQLFPEFSDHRLHSIKLALISRKYALFIILKKYGIIYFLNTIVSIVYRKVKK